VKVDLYRIGQDTPAYQADDMSGTGSMISGGRWNSVGTAVVYAATNRALAAMETLVHLNSGAFPLNRYLIEITVPSDVWAKAKIENASTLAVGWDAEPAGIVSISFGTSWIASGSSALLIIPSVMVPEENNVLINPAHPDAKKITALKVRKWIYDQRLARQFITSPSKPKRLPRTP
jgi:RES domain-containing protein